MPDNASLFNYGLRAFLLGLLWMTTEWAVERPMPSMPSMPSMLGILVPLEPTPSRYEQALVIRTLVRQGLLRWRWLSPQRLPDGVFERRYGRFRAERILVELRRLGGASAVGEGKMVIIGVTKGDISTDIPGFLDHAVLGLSESKGRAMVLSTARLPSVSRERAWVSLILHEWGHWVGLGHCPRVGCAMFDRLGQPAALEWSRHFCLRCVRRLSCEQASSTQGRPTFRCTKHTP